MNTTQNKASLWRSCIEQGIFDQVPSGIQPQVQALFENTIQQFNQEDMDLGKANQLVLREFKLQLGKMIGKKMPQKSFEELNEDYKGQYKAPVPENIEFSKEMDKPIENMDIMLKTKAEQRQNEIHEFFKEQSPLDTVPQIFPMKDLRKSEIQDYTTSTTSSSSIDTQLQLHRRILESILNSQIKIIELLQRK
jgi:hypothetical protein